MIPTAAIAKYDHATGLNVLLSNGDKHAAVTIDGVTYAANTVSETYTIANAVPETAIVDTENKTITLAVDPAATEFVFTPGEGMMLKATVTETVEEPAEDGTVTTTEVTTVYYNAVPVTNGVTTVEIVKINGEATDGVVYTMTFTKACDHSTCYENIEPTEVLDATCGEDGEAIYICPINGEEFTVVLPATGAHTEGEDIIVDTEATCGAAGVGHTVCTECGATVTENIVIEATGAHTAGEWVETVAPTVEAEGVETLYCSVCGAVMETRPIDKLIAELDPTLFKFNAASLSLMNNLAINYKTNISNFTALDLNVEDVYAKFIIGENEYIISEPTIEYNGSTPYRYVYQLTNIAAHQMNERVYATLVAVKDGVEYVSAVNEYGIEFYAYNQLSKSTTKANIKTLLVDLLNYGAAAQLYKKASTPAEELATCRLTDEWKALGTAEMTPAEDILNATHATVETPTVIMKGASLRLDTAVEIRLKFIPNVAIDNLVLRVVTGGETFEIPASEFVKTDTFSKDGSYYAYFAGLNAHQMRNAVDMTFYDGDTAVSNTVRYSIASYVARNQSTSNTALLNLINAMLTYGDSAYNAK